MPTAALMQMKPVLGDVAENLKRTAKLTRLAIKEGADLAVFPELGLTGYLLKDATDEVAICPDSKRFKTLRTLSKDIDILVSGVEPSPTGPYNAAFLIRKGKVKVVHRKRFLPNYGMFNEARHFVPGPDEPQVFATSLGKRTGLLMCEDVWHLESHLALAAQKPDCMVWMCASPVRGFNEDPPESMQTWIDAARTVARFTTTPILVCHRIGFEDGLGFAGGSFMVDATGETVYQAPLREETVGLVDLDPLATRRVRRGLPLLRDLDLSILRPFVPGLEDEG